MRRLILFVLLSTIFLFVHSSCPDAFELAVEGQCNTYYGDMSLVSNDGPNSAVSKCKELQAQPVIIHSKEQNTYWNGRHADDRADLLLGLVCNTTTARWEWADGSAVDYKPHADESDLDSTCTSNSIWYIGAKEENMWFHGFGDASIPFDIYCTAQLHPKQDEISDDACEFFEDDTDDGVCYQVGASVENWNEAQLSCRKLGANLASIHNLQENAFVRRLAVAKGAVTGLYLGATVSGKGGDFGWIDGSEWDYQYFYPGFPIPGFGDCIVMDTSTSTGQWMNTACSAKYPIACVREHKVIAEPTCSSGPFKEGSIVTSPGFPYTASTPCDYYLMVDENKQVEVEILLLEANSCCDFLILYDGYVGGIVLANVTGEVHNATYTTTSSNIMRVSWQPKGGVNVLGMALTFRGV